MTSPTVERPPPRPAPWVPLVGIVTPLASVAVAAVVTGMSAVTAVAALISLLIAMAAAGTFVVSWEPTPSRSVMQSRLVLWLDKQHPNRLQHLYMPVIAAAAGGALSEIVQLLVPFARLGLTFSRHALLGAIAIGVVEGVFVVLVLTAGFGFVSLIPVAWKRHTA